MRPEDPISASIHHRGDAVVLAVKGELDLGGATAFKSAIAEALADDPPALVMDLLGVQFLGSVGVSILVQAHRKVGNNAQFSVVAQGPMTGRILQLLDLDELFPVYETVDEALNALTARQRGTNAT